jgi:ribosomal 50S subunit-recycling heat shock protein
MHRKRLLGLSLASLIFTILFTSYAQAKDIVGDANQNEGIVIVAGIVIFLFLFFLFLVFFNSRTISNEMIDENKVSYNTAYYDEKIYERIKGKKQYNNLKNKKRKEQKDLEYTIKHLQEIEKESKKNAKRRK